MCGFCGFLDFSRDTSEDHARAVTTAMSERLMHRGPDDGGVWVDASTGIALGHRRLSILDLSPAGHQPMLSACGRYVIAYNGEVYNYETLRRELEREGHGNWRGHSDTEVILTAVAAWGLERALQRFVGMFAFALWDREQRTLTLARDRLGEKPLYYGRQGQVLLFGSELKALRAHPAFEAEVDRDALTLLLRHNYIPAPHSIHRGIYKLPPACLITFSSDAPGQPRPVPYWSARQVAEEGQRNPFGGSDAEALDELDRLLSDAVGGQMVADVPLGAFLSGGFDSSTIVALMQAQSSRPVKTFSIGFHEQGFNEAEHAKAVAKHLGTEHTELYVTPEEARAVIPRIPELYDEPFADSSQIPTFLVCQLARQQVTVSLSGDAGDELFCGYQRYFWARDLWNKLGRMPRPLRGAIAGAMTALPAAAWDALLKFPMQLLPAGRRYSRPGDKVHKLARTLNASRPEEIYRELISLWKEPASVVLGGNEPATVYNDPNGWAGLADFEQRLSYMDQVNYLPDDILVKVDRAGMGVSLETRIPLLDHRVVEFAWQLPLGMKIRNDRGKWLLRQLLYRHVPKALVDRPKMGFAVPIDHWLRGTLKGWVEALIDERRLREEGYFDPAPIHEKWREHLNGRHNWSYYLWTILMFQSWLEQLSD